MTVHDAPTPLSPPPAPDAPPEPTLRDALEALARAPGDSLPLLDPRTGETLAVLSRPVGVQAAAPPRLGGMATPLGVYLHDGLSSGGAGPLGLALAGASLCLLALLAQAAVFVLLSALGPWAGRHLPGLSHWAASAPPALRQWLDSALSWLPLPLVFGLLRLSPLAGTHAAEHQAVHCVERGLPLTGENVRAMPRVHPRCGTNLFAGWTVFHFVFLAAFCACRSAALDLGGAVTLSLILAAPPALLFWRRLGGWVQQHFATRPASDAQIRGAIRAAEQVLTRRARLASSPEGYGRVRLLPLRRAWAMGFGPVLLGYGVVLGLLSLLALRWPALLDWAG